MAMVPGHSQSRAPEIDGVFFGHGQVEGPHHCRAPGLFKKRDCAPGWKMERARLLFDAPRTILGAPEHIFPGTSDQLPDLHCGRQVGVP